MPKHASANPSVRGGFASARSPALCTARARDLKGAMKFGVIVSVCTQKQASPRPTPLLAVKCSHCAQRAWQYPSKEQRILVVQLPTGRSTSHYCDAPAQMFPQSGPSPNTCWKGLMQSILLNCHARPFEAVKQGSKISSMDAGQASFRSTIGLP